jgi:hypothetical protein
MIGLAISVDYKWELWGVDEESAQYDELIKGCHKRAAQRILEGCLKNGGLYVKLGQVSKPPASVVGNISVKLCQKQEVCFILC